jgi:hypothetical protein
MLWMDFLGANASEGVDGVLGSTPNLLSHFLIEIMTGAKLYGEAGTVFSPCFHQFLPKQFNITMDRAVVRNRRNSLRSPQRTKFNGIALASEHLTPEHLPECGW